MPKKESAEEKKGFLSLSTIIAFAAFLILALVFFFMLGSSTGQGFGMGYIISSILIAVLVTAFLIWMKSIERKNTYLGITIAILILAALDYSVLTQFQGPYTTLFLIVFSLFYLFYVGYIYFKFKNSNKNQIEYDDSLN